MQNTKKMKTKLKKKIKKNTQMKRRKAFEIRKGKKLEHVRDLNEVEK